MKRPQIEGWTSDAEARELGRLAAGKTVLEVGTFKGFGAVLMAQAGASEVWAVDWHRGDPDLGERDTLCAWWTNVRRHGVEDQVVGLVGRSERVLPALKWGWFDLAFIDGHHAYEAVRADIEHVLPLLRSAGVLAFHDYCSTWPGVVRAVDELVAGEMASAAATPTALFYAGLGLALRRVDSLAVVTMDNALFAES